jgi:hypothetical protein
LQAVRPSACSLMIGIVALVVIAASLLLKRGEAARG